MDATVSEIHCYPLRPPGYVEPLFPTDESRAEIAEHLLRASWLSRASEWPEKRVSSRSSAHTVEEPVSLRRRAGGSVEILRPNMRRCSWRRRRVVEVLARWREVRSWWSEADQVDRLLFRVVVAGGAIVDVARDRSGEWKIVGIVD